MRKDLQMETGKLASQAAHAARLSLLRYIKQHPERLDEFLELNACGSIAVLKAKNLGQLERAFREAQAIDGMPVAMFSDSGHIPLIRVPDPENPSKTIQVPSPHFDGSPVVTGICIGPCLPAEVEHIKKRYNCV